MVLEKIIDPYNVSVRISQAKRPLGRAKHKCEVNVKTSYI
jgi:hypothetical protein